MTTFVDTSALYTLLDEQERAHRRAVDWLKGPGADPGEPLVTHSYVLVECVALVHRRLGVAAVRRLIESHIPALTVWYVDRQLHEQATSAYLATIGRRSSLVDWVSFEMMRHLGISRVFAFDDDFAKQGFESVP